MEHIELKQTSRLNRIDNKKQRKGIKLYVYLLVGFLLILTGLASFWFLSKNAETTEIVKEIPLQLSIDTPSSQTTDGVNSAIQTEENPNTETVKSNLPLVYANGQSNENINQSTETKRSNDKSIVKNSRTEIQQKEAPLIEKQDLEPKIAANQVKDNKPVENTPSSSNVNTNTARQVIPATNQTTVIQTTPAMDLNSQAVQVSTNTNKTTLIAQPKLTAQPNVVATKQPVIIESKNNNPAVNLSSQTVKDEQSTEILNKTSNVNNVSSEAKENTKTTTPEPILVAKNKTQETNAAAQVTLNSSTDSTNKEITSTLTKQLEAQVTQPENKGSEDNSSATNKNTSTEVIVPNKAKDTLKNAQTHTKNKKEQTATKPNTPQAPKQSQARTPPVKINNGQGGNYTIQIASASAPEGLRKLAVSQNLTTARVIETQRNGSTWYVLVTGNYASSQEAKNAIKTLPSKIQANNPWVRKAP